MEIRRADLSPPSELLPRLRWTFLGFSLLSLVAALAVVASGSRVDDTERLLAAAGACWLGWCWVATYRRGHAQVEEDLVSMAALTPLVAALGSPAYALGVLGAGATLRSLYSRPRGSLLAAAFFVLPFMGGVLLADGELAFGRLEAPLLLGLTGVGLGVLIGQLLRAAADRHQRVLDLAQELRRAGELLAAAVNPRLIELVLLRSAQLLLGEAGGIQLVLVRLGGGELLISPPLRAGEEPGGSRLVSPDSISEPVLRYLLGAAAAPPPGSGRAVREFLGIDRRLGQLAVAPLGPSGEARGSLAVASSAPAPTELLDSLRVLSAQAGLALSRAELSLTIRQSEARFRGLVQSSTDLVIAVDRDGQVTYVSPSVESFLGRRLRSTRLDTPSESVHPQDMARVLAALLEAGSTPGPRPLPELRVRRPGEEWRVLEIQATNLLQDPEVQALVLTGRDITERRALEDQLRHQALHDPLTGLANRVLLRDRIDHALHARRRRLPLGLLAIDLDDFKNINDSFGHAAGDAALLEVTRLVRLCLRPGDTFARLGGDEFAVLLEETGGQEVAEGVARRITESLRQPVRLPNWEEVSVTASIGVVTCEEVTDPEVLLRNADIALYAAKAEGKGGHVVFRDFLHQRAMHRMHVESGLRRALERDELALHYQPIVQGSLRHIVGVEALLRWNDPDQGLVMPQDFVAVAEATGLIVPLGRWVISEACRQVRSWQRSLPGRERLALAVNVSARQLQEEGIVAHVEAALATSELDPALLILEVTESVIATNPKEATDRLAKLRRLGVKVAIDDFGTGHSSLAQLQMLPVDCIKIDQSFVSRLSRDSTAAAFIQSMADLARALQLEVVIEGVESARQAKALEALVPTALFQGHHFAPALAPADLQALVTGAKRPRQTRREPARATGVTAPP